MPDFRGESVRGFPIFMDNYRESALVIGHATDDQTWTKMLVLFEGALEDNVGKPLMFIVFLRQGERAPSRREFLDSRDIHIPVVLCALEDETEETFRLAGSRAGSVLAFSGGRLSFRAGPDDGDLRSRIDRFVARFLESEAE